MERRAYIDFKLYLTTSPDGKGMCQIALLPTSEVGETVAPVTVPIGEQPPEDLLALLAGKQITLRDLIALGKTLANCLIPDGVIRERFRYAFDRAGPEGGVRLRLIIADHALKQWPWEYAYLNLTDGPDSMVGFLALSPRVSIVRHEPLPHPHPRLPEGGDDLKALRLAIAAAAPKGQSPLRLDQEVADIQQAVQGMEVDGVRITPAPVLMDATPDDLRRLPQPTHVFHFAGHGISGERRDRTRRGGFQRPDGALLLVKDKVTQEEVRMRAGDLAAILQRCGVRLAVLGACHSAARDARYPWDGVAGALTAAEIPTVIAMQYEVNDDEAIAFGEAFYGALAAGLSLDEATYVGRSAMLMETTTTDQTEVPVTVEWGVPVLYSRLPEGVLFPERMERAGPTAEAFRRVIDQNVERITKAGKVVGVRAKRVGGGFRVSQKVVTVEGELVGADLGTVEDGAEVAVDQDLGTVSGTATGVTLDEI